MIFPALLASAALGLIIFVLGKYFGPGGLLEEQKLRTNNIGSAGSSGVNPAFLRKSKNVSEIGTLKTFLEKHGFSENIEMLLKTSKLKISVSVFLFACVLIGLFFFIFLRTRFGIFPSFVISIFAALTPYFYLNFRRKRYLAKFAEHLPNVLSSLSSSIRAGRSLEAAFDVAAHSAPRPISEEFEVVRSEMKLGVPLDQALWHMYQRIRNPELKILITGVAIHQELGGNLSEILDNLEKTIRERFALLREVHTLSAQGRYSAWALFAVPFILALIYMKSDPAMFMQFLTSNFGSHIIWIVLGMNLAGFFWMRRVIRLGD